ncbi:MAG TPA: pilin N-terminal domain-containing protein [Lachnospiraceae bacterium]
MKKLALLLKIVCMAFVFSFISSSIVLASDKNSLDIIFMYEKTPIKGAEFSLYQVATLNSERNTYKMLDSFTYSGDFSDIDTAEKSLQLAKDLSRQVVEENKIATLKTQADGMAGVTDLEDGIYLVVQSGAGDEAKEYTRVEPFLVMVPMYIHGEWESHVKAHPKPEITKGKTPPPDTPKPPKPPSPPKQKEKGPKTGDFNHLFFWVGMLLMSGSFLFGLRRQRKEWGNESK